MFMGFLAAIKKIKSIIKSKLISVPRFSLCHPSVKIDRNNQKPYFSYRLIANPHGEAEDVLYIDDLNLNREFYQRCFSNNDWNLIQYNLGALDALQLASNYKLIEVDYENMQIKMINKSNGQEQKSDIAKVILSKQYMNFDKQSIFELATFFESCKSSEIVQLQIERLKKNSLNDDLLVTGNSEEQRNVGKSHSQKPLPPYIRIVK